MTKINSIRCFLNVEFFKYKKYGFFFVTGAKQIKIAKVSINNFAGRFVNVIALLYLLVITISTYSRESNDITCVMISDLHYGASNMIAVNQATIDYLNTFPGASYPASMGGGIVDTFRGVCVLGDVTDHGRQNEWNKFIEDWGVNGEQRIKYPVYEGWGNHDGNISQITAKGMRDRTAHRKDLTKVSEDGFHYSWDWDHVHFVQLNRYTSVDSLKAGNSLGFLKEDLAESVGTSGRPVILLQHYGFDTWSMYEWWSEEDREALLYAIKDYNVIAIFNGHTHGMEHIKWYGIDTYSDGSTKGWGIDGGTCLVVHIKLNNMRVLGLVPDGWRGSRYMWEKTFDIGNIAVSHKTEKRPEQFGYFSGQKLYLKMKGNTLVNLSVLDLRGRTVYKKFVSGQSVIELGAVISVGSYIIQADCGGVKIFKRKITILK